MNGLKKQAQADTFAKVDIIYSANRAGQIVLSNELAALGITRKAHITITVNPGVFIGKLNLDGAAANSRIKLIVLGNIIGDSGGGDALVVGYPVSIDNRGRIASGGGHGGNGGNGSHGYLGGDGTTGYACVFNQVQTGGAGGQGSGMRSSVFVEAAAGELGVVRSDSGARGGNGGNGGGLGTPGNPGLPGFVGNSWQGGTKLNADGTTTYYPTCGVFQGGINALGGRGGDPGAAIRGIAKVTFVNRGNIIGPTV